MNDKSALVTRTDFVFLPVTSFLHNRYAPREG